MRLSTFTAGFQEYEQSLDYYHGKDVVHQGCLLKLDPGYSWERINGKIRNKIRKAQKLENVRIERVEGTAEHIKAFRTIWFDAEDETLPEKLEADEVMYLAYMDDQLSGGLILTPSSPSVLYMHNLGSNEEGKRANLPGLILWNAVEELKDSKWQYIDVGVSFRPTLYTFFKNWQTDSYPIIFSPPFIRPDIRLTPFLAADIPVYRGATNPGAGNIVSQYFGEEYTILPRAIHCLLATLKHLSIQKQDNVAVFKTFPDNDYLSGCVSQPIEKYCNIVNKIDEHTKAVLVVHEFGFPCEQTMELKAECQKKGIPLIEDCAWAYGSRLDNDHAIGDVGDYAFFSLPKFTALPYGAVLKGLTITDGDNWNDYQMLDYFKRELVLDKLRTYLPQLAAHNDTRRHNWQRLAALFGQDGFETLAELKTGVYPGAFLVRLDDFQAAFERYAEFGVETGRYYQGQALFLPVHQNLSDDQIDYIYGVFRGKLNLSSNYQRGGKKQ